MKSPRVLLISHYHQRESEAWLTNLRESIRENLCGEAYFDTGQTDENRLSLTPRWWRAVLRTGIVDHWKFAPPRKAALADYIRKTCPDVVYCHFANLALRLKPVWDAIDIPVVIHCHGYDVSFDMQRLNRTRCYPRNYVNKVVSLAPRCHFIANSRFTFDRLVAAGLDRSDVSQWHFGVPTVTTTASVATTLGRPVKRVLFLGRLIGCKGPLETLRAFKIARDQGLQAECVIAGHGRLSRQCQTLILESDLQDVVSLPGKVTHSAARELIRNADLFTGHTRLDPDTNQSEAFGVSFAEAMGAGLPIVTGNHAGPASFLIHERNALLFPPNDVAAHARCLLRVANDDHLRHRLASNALTDAQKLFDPARQTASLLSILTNVAENSTSR